MIVAAIIGVLAALCVVMGILTAAALVPPISESFDGLFWLALAGVLLIALMTGVVIKASQELLQLLG